MRRLCGILACLVHRLRRKVHLPSEMNRCTASKLVGRLLQTDESSVWVGPLAPKLNRAPLGRAGASARVVGSGRDELGQIGSVCKMRRWVQHLDGDDAARDVGSSVMPGRTPR